MFKYVKIFFEILFAILICEFAFFIIGGVWHGLVSLFADRLNPNHYFFLRYSIYACIPFFITNVFDFCFPVIFRIYKRSSRLNMSSLNGFLIGFLVIFISFLFVIVISYFCNFISFDLIKITEQKKGVTALLEKTIFVYVLTNLIIVIAEEITFRGFLYNVLTYKFKNRLISIFLVSIVFSLSHFHYTNAYDYIIAFICGIATCYSYYKTKSIFVPIGFHFGYNLLYGLISIEKVIPELINPLLILNFSSAIGGHSGYFEIGIMVLGLVVFIIVPRRKFFNPGT